MPRRGSNIYKRKDGRFEGRVPIGHKEDGSLKYKFVYARTLSEVKEKMAQFQAVLQSQPVSALKLTVAEASRQWLSAAKLRVKPSSYAHYENIIRNHILPDLGTKYLTDMTTHQLNDLTAKRSIVRNWRTFRSVCTRHYAGLPQHRTVCGAGISHSWNTFYYAESREKAAGCFVF